MMGKLADRDKRIVQSMMGEGDMFNDMPYFSRLPQQKPPFSGSPLNRVSLRSSRHSSASSSFSNGFCSAQCGSQYDEREKRVAENMKKDGGLFNDAPNVPYLNLVRQQNLLSIGSPACRASLQSPEPSPSSSLFPSGFCSPEYGSLYAPPLSEEANYLTPGSQYWNELCLDSKSPHHDSYKINNRLVDELGLTQSFCGMSIRDDQNGSTKMKGFEIDPDGFGFGSVDGSLGGSVYNVKKYGSYGDFNNGVFDNDGFQSSPQGVSWSTYDDLNYTFNGLQSGFGKDAHDSMGASFAHNQSKDFCSGPGWYDNQTDHLFGRRKEQGESWSVWGTQSQNQSITGPYLDDPSSFPLHYKMDSNGGRGVLDSLGAPQSMNPILDLDVYHPAYRRSLMLQERIRATTNSGLSHSLMPVKCAGDADTFSCEDSFIVHGKGFNHASNKGREHLSSDKKNSFNETSVQNLRGKFIKQDSAILHGGSWENDQRLNYDNPLPMVQSINSLSEVQGNIYLMAQDQNGCRWLQRIFDEGTSQDVQIIFNEIIDHVVELMLKPFGNYVIQKFLDVCNEEQRLQVVFMVTEEQGQLVDICLNTYGTRAAQKLIETLKTRQQISLVVSSLKLGFLDLVKDQNGNHVIQRCLQCLSNEDNKFILDAAAKFCVEIATHRHGCCVMQRCITHSTGKHRDKLITEISKNSLLLAQDPFGNYVVQYIIELKSPSAIVNLLSQFKWHYVNLSTQKFSSHVVEKCLRHLDQSREQIVHELISVSRFEQLLQDPFANYVIQSALAVTKGPLLYLLVDAVRPHMTLRTNLFSKRIFSKNLLKKYDLELC